MCRKVDPFGRSRWCNKVDFGVVTQLEFTGPFELTNGLEVAPTDAVRCEVAPASCRHCLSSNERGAGGTPALLKPRHRRIGSSRKLSHHRFWGRLLEFQG